MNGGMFGLRLRGRIVSAFVVGEKRRIIIRRRAGRLRVVL